MLFQWPYRKRFLSYRGRLGSPKPVTWDMHNYITNNNTALELYAAVKDLGVWISKDLTWYKPVNEQSSRANKLLGYLKRNTRVILRTEVRRTPYLALVRPHLGYATQIWAPQSIALLVKLERIQRRATKFILKLPYSTNIRYKSRLQTLDLIPICYWHELLDVTFFFQIDTRSR